MIEALINVWVLNENIRAMVGVIHTVPASTNHRAGQKLDRSKKIDQRVDTKDINITR